MSGPPHSRHGARRSWMDVTAKPAQVSRAERMKTGGSPTAIGSSVPKKVVGNLRYFRTVLGAPRDDVDRVIEATDLGAHAGQLGGVLSGGQRSRVSLAGELLGSPELLVLDEPTIGLNPVPRAELWLPARSDVEGHQRAVALCFTDRGRVFSRTPKPNWSPGFTNSPEKHRTANDSWSHSFGSAPRSTRCAWTVQFGMTNDEHQERFPDLRAKGPVATRKLESRRYSRAGCAGCGATGSTIGAT